MAPPVSISWGVLVVGVLVIRAVPIWGLFQGPVIFGNSEHPSPATMRSRSLRILFSKIFTAQKPCYMRPLGLGDV